MKYDVVVSNDLKKLLEKVNELLQQGYEPYGELKIYRTGYGHEKEYTQVVIIK